MIKKLEGDKMNQLFKKQYIKNLLRSIGSLFTGILCLLMVFSASAHELSSGSDNEKINVYQYLLNEQGVSIISMGETKTIIIASDVLFQPHSANLSPSYRKNLSIITKFINQYDTVSVSVKAYTNKSDPVALALTEKQAQNVLRFLDNHGLNTRLVYAQGEGNHSPVSRNNHYFNRRVEIKFQFYPAERLF